ncbi:hypothetical protein [Pseudogracilibacillus sp. SO30301A]|uniref:hypothetical protein n=1 Tax=Pseudogracilibacillus sp. SO30301A TaxID=3098291 RepID=UPI00300E3BBA
MRKFFIIIFSIMVLTGCSQLMDDILYKFADGERVTKQVSEEEIENDDDSDMERNNNLIDDENFLNEREAIENLMEKQRELLKPGFIKNEKNVIDLQLDYIPLDGILNYSAYYEGNQNVPMIFYKGMINFNEKVLEDRYSEFQNKKKLDHDKIDGMYGLMGDSYQTYDMWGQYKGNVYNIGVAKENDETNEKLVEMISQTLKTEAEGAYDPLYSIFSIDIDKIKFPKLNNDYSELSALSIIYFGYDDKLSLDVTYLIGGYDTIRYSILEKEETMSDYYTSIGDVETENGVKVTIYEEDDRDNEIYKWTDGTYFYELDFWKQDKSLVNSADILAIIDSAMEDERVFENKEVFKATNVHPKLGKPEKKLEKYLNK